MIARSEGASANGGSPDRILYRLRDLSEAGLNEGTGISGGVGSYGSSATLKNIKPGERSPAERVAYQTRVSPFVSNSADLTVQASVSADRRYVRLSMSPIFNTVGSVRTTPFVNNPLLPGSPPAGEP